MNAIGTAEAAEDAAVASPRPSAAARFFAVFPALAPSIRPKKRLGIPHRKIAGFVTAVVGCWQWPNHAADANKSEAGNA
jgi:hypothetical protein